MYPPYPPYPPHHNPRLWAAAQKNYTTNAVWGLLLYFLFWLPGLLVNCYYLYDAYQTKKVTGHNPQGMSCLWTTLILFNFPFLFLLLFLLYALVVASVTSVNPFTANSFAQANQVASEQQAVSDANSQLGYALISLRNDTSTLSSFSEANTLSSYARDWQTMQKNYTTEQKDAQKGCGDSNYNQGTVQYDAGAVDYELGSIQSDDGALSSDKGTYDSDLSAAQSDIQSVNSAWSSLQQAVANNTTGMPAPQYTAKDISDALSNAQSTEKTAKDAWQAAQAKATQYDQEANALKQQADALPGSMHC